MAADQVSVTQCLDGRGQPIVAAEHRAGINEIELPDSARQLTYTKVAQFLEVTGKRRTSIQPHKQIRYLVRLRETLQLWLGTFLLTFNQQPLLWFGVGPQHELECLLGGSHLLQPDAPERLDQSGIDNLR